MIDLDKRVEIQDYKIKNMEKNIKSLNDRLQLICNMINKIKFTLEKINDSSIKSQIELVEHNINSLSSKLTTLFDKIVTVNEKTKNIEKIPFNITSIEKDIKKIEIQLVDIHSRCEMRLNTIFKNQNDLDANRKDTFSGLKDIKRIEAILRNNKEIYDKKYNLLISKYIDPLNIKIKSLFYTSGIIIGLLTIVNLLLAIREHLFK